jgi:hypothetical protein
MDYLDNETGERRTIASFQSGSVLTTLKQTLQELLSGQPLRLKVHDDGPKIIIIEPGPLVQC